MSRKKCNLAKSALKIKPHDMFPFNQRTQKFHGSKQIWTSGKADQIKKKKSINLQIPKIQIILIHPVERKKIKQNA